MENENSAVAGPEISTEFIKAILTEDEIRELGLEMAKKFSEVELLDSQKSATAADFTSRIKAKNLEINSASRKIQDGFEMRYEDCEVVHDFELRLVQYFYRGEKVKDRKMTDDEIQAKIPGM